ncbi:hypothetical protein [Microbacterium aurugineum]
MQRARFRGPWWFVAGGVILVVAFQSFRGSTLARQDMGAHLTFPATYWRTDDAGGVIIEAGERHTRFQQDDPLLLGGGWGKVYVLTPCTEEYTATFVTPNANYSD